jgi:hypothetical protein
MTLTPDLLALLALTLGACTFLLPALGLLQRLRLSATTPQ